MMRKILSVRMQEDECDEYEDTNDECAKELGLPSHPSGGSDNVSGSNSAPPIQGH